MNNYIELLWKPVCTYGGISNTNSVPLNHNVLQIISNSLRQQTISSRRWQLSCFQRSPFFDLHFNEQIGYTLNFQKCGKKRWFKVCSYFQVSIIKLCKQYDGTLHLYLRLVFELNIVRICIKWSLTYIRSGYDITISGWYVSILH